MRVSTSYIFVVPLWVLINWLFVQEWGFQIFPIAFGITLGALYGIGIARGITRKVETKGEYRFSRETQVGQAFTLLALFGGSYFVVVALAGVSLAVHSTAQALFSFVPAMSGTEGILFRTWEGRNGKHINSEGFFPSKLYLVPGNSASSTIRKFCTSCGATLVTDSKFCSTCGTQVR